VSKSVGASFNPRNTRLTQVTHVQKEKDDPKRWIVFFIYLVSVQKLPFTALRLPGKHSFTKSKLLIFGLARPIGRHAPTLKLQRRRTDGTALKFRR